MRDNTWDWRRVYHALGLPISQQKIPRGQDACQAIYRGIKVILLPDPPHAIAEGGVKVFAPRRSGKSRVVVECGCGRTVCYGRMPQHAAACNDAMATLDGRPLLCSCENCVKNDRWVEYQQCQRITASEILADVEVPASVFGPRRYPNGQRRW